MGEPIRILDLARHMITMAGLVPGTDIPIVFTGLRPGEKLTETLLSEQEEKTRVVRNGVFGVQSPPPPEDLWEELSLLKKAADSGERPAILETLGRLVGTFRQAAEPAAYFEASDFGLGAPEGTRVRGD
jgi:FlaA1/EpsC-like NDP-sugar epimerase